MVPKSALGADATALDGLNEGLNLGVFPVIDDAERDVHLGVDDALRGEFADHVVGDEFIVVGAFEASGNGSLNDVHEAEEVLVDDRACAQSQRVSGSASWRLAKFEQRCRKNGAFEVKVELDFRQLAEPFDEDRFRVAGFGALLAISTSVELDAPAVNSVAYTLGHRATSRAVKVTRTAKILMNNRSQAVRLLKDFQVQHTSEVFIRRQGNDVVLSPRPSNWAAYLASPGASEEYMNEVEDLPMQEREF